ncbi:hypothetical protein BX616_003357 [Lobosporangium transversale]|uniref:BZIP domain-containing protein n=1 Tax=Lobosporangium transversale TaxID=64571 RepID=A0A1Y2H395_9FUNG|nr:hypothetical protein BCR41DRAFT_366684 [Lobosporangium transversale]KAF9899021.1 hypothetical protein BX616_003357 [Lobosporangium transversale]ORZ29017.1 hypothetical protein BCR41DRAFT_366684 [Lobosporangium transversale]|eukprot:XP_021886690.1 hypothetical protein BCR41DRAFT_366684 [Lobosporangium transversale]
MAISFDFTMFDMTDPKLTKSADALESALAQFGKVALPAVNNDTNDVFATPASTATVTNNGCGFDEWLANDFQLGVLSGDDVSLTSSPFSALDDSPDLGFDSFGTVMGPSLFDMALGVNNDLVTPVSTPAPSIVAPVLSTAPAQVKVPSVTAPSSLLTSAALQQAAAALNIPWSRDLELAVIAQANAATVLNTSSSAAPLNTTPAVVPKSEPVEQSITSVPVPVSAVKFVPASAASKKRALSPPEENEEIIAKRAKNTDAARRSRLKKLVRLETLEAKVAELEATNNRLTMKVAILETEKNGHLSKEADQSARIAQLEAKLAEAHSLLTSRASA